jgi:hypothetical protein
VRFGELCVGVANEHHDWFGAANVCNNLSLRLPAVGEAKMLATNHDLPNVDQSEEFWTDEYVESGVIWTVNDSGGSITIPQLDDAETVCVTTPTN